MNTCTIHRFRRAVQLHWFGALTWSIVLSFAVGACAGYRGGDVGDGGWVDQKVTRFSFIGEGVGATLIVGTQAARFREDMDYMPVEIAVANTGRDALTLTRESFTLMDQEGRRYSAASPQELLEGYDLLDMDRSAFAELPSVAPTVFPGYRATPSKFSPTRRVRAAGQFIRDVVQDEVPLTTSRYLVDFIYFPKPVTGIKGFRFELVLEAPSLPEPVVVSFVVG